MYCSQCPKGLASRRKSSYNKKNGFRGGKQSYKCKNCPKGRCGHTNVLSRFAYGYQYVENPISRAYPSEVKQLCLKMYKDGMGFRAIARVTKINHTNTINWVKEAGESLPDEVQFEIR